ncbi:hypothetical protein DES53_1067 [Roseimicrobium gellanilyticum]|uniref:Uncharacterized protein n=1 Tax=Roseimicrobium gellanilyticum TaxID=748857 RepID=A0A366HKL0_9BACT|nr:hypothetical protein [Roseimicrobium gellanilyticum]RBP42303.1 hypothetical protein DES53_1067 [Roseimicrobium gellanilyticum]
MKELERTVQDFVTADTSASVNAFALWSRIEHAIAACRDAAAGSPRHKITSSSLLRPALGAPPQ